MPFEYTSRLFFSPLLIFLLFPCFLSISLSSFLFLSLYFCFPLSFFLLFFSTFPLFLFLFLFSPSPFYFLSSTPPFLNPPPSYVVICPLSSPPLLLLLLFLPPSRYTPFFLVLFFFFLQIGRYVMILLCKSISFLLVFVLKIEFLLKSCDFWM